jgi:hypothetical protein
VGIWLLVSGCQGTNEPARPVPEDSAIPIVMVDRIDRAAWVRDPYRITHAMIAKDLLKLEVVYGGGCRTHTFKLIWAEGFEAPQFSVANILLAHAGGADQCKAQYHVELEADLSQIKKEWRQLIGQEEGAILLQLDSFDGELRYEF